MLRLEDVALAAGGEVLVEGIDVHVRPGDRIGLVGRNGSGKTTLLRVVAGEQAPWGGRIHRQGGVLVGYLPQQAVSGSSRSVWDEAASGMVRMRALIEELGAAERAVEQGDEGAIARLDAVQERFRLAGGWALDEQIGEVLHGLGFGPDTWHRPCDTFSGGWQMRVALARLLLSEPDVLLLDEPTNHLDMASRSWLASHLATLDRAMLIVSHDRHLLDVVTNRTAEIRGGRFDVFTGGFSAWIAERERRDEHALLSREREQAERARLERFVERFGAKATKASQARSRKKALERLEVTEAPVHERPPRLSLPEAPGCAREALELRGATLGWDGVPLLTGVDLVVERGDRWAILGPNGAGKSTLLHALTGRQPLLGGQRRVGRDVRLGVYAQDLAQELPPDATPLELVLAGAPAALPERARAVLGALGLTGEDALRPVGQLSGGEKARVVLAGFALRPCNVLLLDEPTNHLDAVTVDVLAEALAAWEGAVVLVTHDRWLVERLATHVAVVGNGGVATHLGVQPEHLEPARARARSAARSEPTRSAPARAHEERKDRKRARRRLDKLSAEADGVAETLGALEARMFEAAADHVRLAQLEAERQVAEARLESLFEEMATLEDEVAGG